MIRLQQNRIVRFADTGRICVDVFYGPFAEVSFDDLLEEARKDFANLNMPYVFGVKNEGIESQSRLNRALWENKIAFEDWSSVGISRHGFFAFSRLTDLLHARLLI